MEKTDSLDKALHDCGVYIGQVIRESRKRKGLTQTDLARLSCSTQQLISFWETGRQLPSVYSLVRIAHALDLEVKISFGGGESCSPETK